MTNGRKVFCHGGCGLLVAVARNERLMPALDAAQRYFCPLCGADPAKNKIDYGYVFRRRLQFWLANGGRDVAAEAIAFVLEKVRERIIREEAKRRLAWTWKGWRKAA